MWIREKISYFPVINFISWLQVAERAVLRLKGRHPVSPRMSKKLEVPEWTDAHGEVEMKAVPGLEDKSSLGDEEAGETSLGLM